MPFCLEAAILSRIRSPVTSRSNWAKDSRTLSVRRPIEVVVLNCWVTATKETPRASNTSTILAKSVERAGQAVDLVDHHDIDQALIDISQQTLQRRSLHRPAGQTAIVISGLDQAPSFTGLALDERFAGLALRMQRVEVLLQSFFGRFARIDRAAANRCLSVLHGCSP